MASNSSGNPSALVCGGRSAVAMTSKRSESIHAGPPTISRGSKPKRWYPVRSSALSVVFVHSSLPLGFSRNPVSTASDRFGLIDTTSKAGEGLAACCASPAEVAIITKPSTRLNMCAPLDHDVREIAKSHQIDRIGEDEP